MFRDEMLKILLQQYRPFATDADAQTLRLLSGALRKSVDDRKEAATALLTRSGARPG